MGCCLDRGRGATLGAGSSDRCDAGVVWWASSRVPLAITAIALFIVLDRLDVGNAAVCRFGGCAGGLVCDRVAAAVDVYDLGAHGEC